MIHRYFPAVKSAIKRNRRLYSILRSVAPFFRAINKGYRRLFPKRFFSLDLRSQEEKRKVSLKRRALVSYLVHPFSIYHEDPLFFRHSNIWQSYEIVQILNEFGFLVDVVDFRDVSFVPKKSYDLFLGHGDNSFLSIVRNLPEKAKKIYYSTSNFWQYRNQAVVKRYEALSYRKKTDIFPMKMIPSILEKVLEMSDGIIGIGGDFTKKTYEGFDPVIMVANSTFPDDRYDYSKKKFDQSRSHFLFFGGDDNIRKGLDLLLDAFVSLQQHLWICSFINEPVARLYAKELKHYSNIHLVGNVMLQSKQFYKVADTCAFSILPSCSEGQPGSVIECMNYGLIPIISEACSVDVNGFGDVLKYCTIEEIRQTVERCSIMPVKQCQSWSEKARKEAAKRFSPEVFHENMTTALKHFI